MNEYKLAELAPKLVTKLAKKFYLHCPVCSGQICLIEGSFLTCMGCGPEVTSVLIDDAAIANDKTLAAIAKERAAIRQERAKTRLGKPLRTAQGPMVHGLSTFMFRVSRAV